jgi:ferredoxin-NADP reductase/predicted pyridoxine 5'-phosphate oxidase superfamily flavin-nucleotide-binding protein
MSFSIGMPWNEGEEKMHRLLRVPPQDNPTSAMLTPQAAFMFQRAPLLAFGTLDAQSRPWTTLWGGEPGFSEPLGGGFVGTRTLVDGKNDPVVQALVGNNVEGEMTQTKNGGKLVAGLAIDLMTRKRVKTAGRMIAGTTKDVDVEVENEENRSQTQLQLVTKIEQSLGNCPKYLNQYEIRPALVNPVLVSQASSLSIEATFLISKSDMFFLATNTEDDMDVNHRGGPAGFVRIVSPTTLAYPEYSGNRLYQSLGNLMLNPKIGITFPDYETGNVVYMTGTTEILAGADAAALLPGSNLAVKITIQECRFVEKGLPFRGTKKTPSPYNPLVRTLATEGNMRAALSASSSASRKTASLVKKEMLTSSIARFTFSVEAGLAYRPGQWIALDFSTELDTGYEHMRDEDPTSLNDDFVRTFTISSIPAGGDGDREMQFEITIRRVGVVTAFLFQQNERAGLEVGVLGTGGAFTVNKAGGGKAVFVAGGVGVTPLFGQVRGLDLQSTAGFTLLWAVRGEDLGFVRDTLARYPGLAGCTRVFLTGRVGQGDLAAMRDEVKAMAEVVERRMVKGDVDGIEAETWYVCAGKGMRKEVTSWLEGQKVVFEDFDY